MSARGLGPEDGWTVGTPRQLPMGRWACQGSIGGWAARQGVLPHTSELRNFYLLSGQEVWRAQYRQQN